MGCVCGWKAYKGYGARRFVVLAIGMLLAFWLGMKMGEIKGFMKSMYGESYGHGHRGDMMMNWGDNEGGMRATTTLPTPPAPTTTAPAAQ